MVSVKNNFSLLGALEKVLEYCETDQKSGIAYSDNGVLVPMLRAALAEPARNCDVGTADEQMGRYCKFTYRYNPCSYRGDVRCAEDCPIHIKLKREGHGELLCQLEWAQMPYENGGE